MALLLWVADGPRCFRASGPNFCPLLCDFSAIGQDVVQHFCHGEAGWERHRCWRSGQECQPGEYFLHSRAALKPCLSVWRLIKQKIKRNGWIHVHNLDMNPIWTQGMISSINCFSRIRLLTVWVRGKNCKVQCFTPVDPGAAIDHQKDAMDTKIQFCGSLEGKGGRRFQNDSVPEQWRKGKNL